MARLQNPSIVIPGVTGTSLHDDYPLDTRDIWTMVLHREYQRIALHPDDLRYETFEPSHVYPGRLFSVYNDLIESLRHDLSAKADKPTPVFAFPYDWRRRIQNTAAELDEFVEEVIARTGLLRHYAGYEEEQKVDLVGHSMGGLIITEYLHKFGHKKRIGKVATLGTPFRGSLEAIVKLTTGLGNLSGSKPSERERESARTMPAIYQMTPWYLRATVSTQNRSISLLKADNWQRSILESLQEYVRLKSVRHHKTVRERESRANEILQVMLNDAKALRDSVKNLNLASAGLQTSDWLAVVGVGEKTLNQLVVEGLPDKPRFQILTDRYEEKWKKDKSSRRTGDGTVALEGALPPFLETSQPVCVCRDDFSFYEIGDQVLTAFTTLHAMLPNLNLAQRLVLKHLRPEFNGKVWGRRVPGETAWNPPIKKLEKKEKDAPGK